MKIRHGRFDFEDTADGKFRNITFHNPLGGTKSLNVKGAVSVQDLKDMHFPHGEAARDLQSYLDMQKARVEDEKRIKLLRNE
jgi:hypothetical protein